MLLEAQYSLTAISSRAAHIEVLILVSIRFCLAIICGIPILAASEMGLVSKKTVFLLARDVEWDLGYVDWQS